MDYEELLKKYIARIIENESIDYLDNDHTMYNRLNFTDEELIKLKELSEQARHEYKI